MPDILSPYQNKNQSPAEKLLAIIANSVSKDEFKSTLETVLKLILQQEQKNMEAIKALEKGYQAVISKTQNDHLKGLNDLKGQVDNVFVGEQVQRMIQEHQAKMKAVDDKLSTVRNGIDGDPKTIIKDVLGLITIPKPKHGSPDTASQVRDKLETLKGEQRLDKKAIKGWDDWEKHITQKNVHLAAGFRGFDLFSDGTDHGPTSYVDFVGGTNVTITHSKVGNRDILTFSATGGGSSGTSTVYVDTVSGTIDGANVTFTVSNTIVNPFILVLAGSSYQYGVDYTVSGSTITFLTAPDSSLSGQPFFLVHITGSTVYNSTISGTINSVNTSFTVTDLISNPACLVLGNSIYQYGTDFTTAGLTITFTVAPDISLSGQPFFLIHGSDVSLYINTVSGTINGSNTAFTVANTISQALLLVLANAPYQSTVDYTVSGTTVTYLTPPDSSLSGSPHFFIHT